MKSVLYKFQITTCKPSRSRNFWRENSLRTFQFIPLLLLIWSGFSPRVKLVMDALLEKHLLQMKFPI